MGARMHATLRLVPCTTTIATAREHGIRRHIHGRGIREFGNSGYGTVRCRLWAMGYGIPSLYGPAGAGLLAFTATQRGVLARTRLFFFYFLFTSSSFWVGEASTRSISPLLFALSELLVEPCLHCFPLLSFPYLAFPCLPCPFFLVSWPTLHFSTPLSHPPFPLFSCPLLLLPTSV